MNEDKYREWLIEHLRAATSRYEEVADLDEKEYLKNGSSEFYEQSNQMFGYVAALEKCLTELGQGKSPLLRPRQKKRKGAARK